MGCVKKYGTRTSNMGNRFHIRWEKIVTNENPRRYGAGLLKDFFK